MATRFSGQEKPLFFLEKQGFSSTRMTRVGRIVNGYHFVFFFKVLIFGSSMLYSGNVIVHKDVVDIDSVVENKSFSLLR